MKASRVTINTAIIAVDIQNDFCPGGALPVPEGYTIVSVINLYVTKYTA